MAIKPLANTSTKQPRFNPTALVIAGSMVISIILATVVAGNPFSAVRRAYATLDGQAERPVPTQPAIDSGNASASSNKTNDPSVNATDAGAGGRDTTAVPGAAPNGTTK